MRCLVAVLALTACTDDPGPASAGDPLDDPELPARGDADVRTWLAAGYYQAWRCEAAAHPARAPSPHGASRICNNAALVGATGAFPPGAAAVKELLDGSAIIGYAVSRKLREGGGDAWYWYEAQGDRVFANGEGAGNCTSCHTRAARDFVFTIVP